MWCPEDFVLLSEAQQACQEISALRLKELMESGALSHLNLEDCDVEFALSQWLMAHFVECHGGQFFAALTNGGVVRLSPLATEVAFPIEDYFDTSEANIKSLLTLSWRGLFSLIDPGLFVLDTVSFPNRQKLMSDWMEIAEVMRPLHGAPICFRKNLDFRGFILLAARSADANSENGTSTVLTMRTRQIAAQEYWAKYPSGHKSAGVSFSEAARRLGYDRKTLRMGLKESPGAGEVTGD